MGDAFHRFGFDQRHALWEILGFEFAEREALHSRPGTQLPLRWSVPATSSALTEKLRHLRLLPSGDQLSLFASLTPAEAIHADYRSYSTSTRGHERLPPRIVCRSWATATLIASKSASAIAGGKQLFYRQLEMPLGEAYSAAGHAIACDFFTDDGREGVDAFLGKRPPRWPGRE